MKKIDKDGLILCELQAKTFESSVDYVETSSEVFVRRFMNSKIAKTMDNLSILHTNVYEKDLLLLVEEQYGKSKYGTVKFTHDEMFWMGYLYRYFCYTYELTSVQAYKAIKPKELKGLFAAYHTLDTAQAIERILESKKMLFNETEEIKRQYEIYKRIKNKHIEKNGLE